MGISSIGWGIDAKFPPFDIVGKVSEKWTPNENEGNCRCRESEQKVQANWQNRANYEKYYGVGKIAKMSTQKIQKGNVAAEGE